MERLGCREAIHHRSRRRPRSRRPQPSRRRRPARARRHRRHDTTIALAAAGGASSYTNSSSLGPVRRAFSQRAATPAPPRSGHGARRIPIAMVRPRHAGARSRRRGANRGRLATSTAPRGRRPIALPYRACSASLVAASRPAAPNRGPAREHFSAKGRRRGSCRRHARRSGGRRICRLSESFFRLLSMDRCRRRRWIARSRDTSPSQHQHADGTARPASRVAHRHRRLSR